MTAGDDWFRRAVFYEVLLRSFADGDGDGTGDFVGLTAKLDHLAWLGIDCVWVPPFFPSAWRDGGYDVTDYCDVDPAVGTLADFDAFIAAAHERGIRVIIDFVMNHTSDAHPWFQASRSDPDGPYGDYYVWRDHAEDYADARIIFLDTETSNWTWDENRGQYFWHRFFFHQPDLNFDNPRVLEEMLTALRFWLARGVDGFRLDAVPYLVERPGTNGENLPETHAILKQVRAMVDAEFPGRILLCEANQWPSDVVEYFGEGDECHLAFHFPVMPRMYMALRREDRTCLSEILADTPMIPAGCQWGTFLRNHDELTLEMVTPAEREYMWGEYAPEPRMRSNLGIRRRLAPLVDNDGARVRLLNAMLLALPGSPVLYYGDEIGMGDNIWLADRDGVRTPMQWDATPSGGFSPADPDTFPYPVVTDPRFSPDVVNVAAQREDPTSLLHFMRDLLALRRDNPLLADGNFRDLGGSPQVFSFLRSIGDEAILCCFNLAGTEQTTELDLSWLAGAEQHHLWSGADLGPVPGGQPYEVTLPPHGWTWIKLTGLAKERADVWNDYVLGARWFAGKGRGGQLVELTNLPWLTPADTDGVPTSWPAIRPVIARVDFPDGEHERYQLLATYRPVTDTGPAGLGVVNLDGYGPARVTDLVEDPDALVALADALLAGVDAEFRDWRLGAGLHADSPSPFADPSTPLAGRAQRVEAPAFRFFGGEQSNSSALLGPLMVKFQRKLTVGPRVEADQLRALAGVEGVPQLRGTITAQHGEDLFDLALVTDLVADATDGWDHALAQAAEAANTAWVRQIGLRLASVHTALAARGTETVPGERVAAGMRALLAEAEAELPALVPHVDDLNAVFDALAGDEVVLQRVHGDFHLGQTLLSPEGWHIIDFEGEPLKRPSENELPDSPWRDVAGMLRSLDYARASTADAERPAALEWLENARQAFCDGYAEGREITLTEADRRAIAAYEASKAVYELVYEARNRPAWVGIPLRAVARLVKESR